MVGCLYVLSVRGFVCVVEVHVRFVGRKVSFVEDRVVWIHVVLFVYRTCELHGRVVVL